MKTTYDVEGDEAEGKLGARRRGDREGEGREEVLWQHGGGCISAHGEGASGGMEWSNGNGGMDLERGFLLIRSGRVYIYPPSPDNSPTLTRLHPAYTVVSDGRVSRRLCTPSPGKARGRSGDPPLTGRL